MARQVITLGVVFPSHWQELTRLCENKFVTQFTDSRTAQRFPQPLLCLSLVFSPYVGQRLGKSHKTIRSVMCSCHMVYMIFPWRGVGVHCVRTELSRRLQSGGGSCSCPCDAPSLLRNYRLLNHIAVLYSFLVTLCRSLKPVTPKISTIYGDPKVKIGNSPVTSGTTKIQPATQETTYNRQ